MSIERIRERIRTLDTAIRREARLIERSGRISHRQVSAIDYEVLLDGHLIGRINLLRAPDHPKDSAPWKECFEYYTISVIDWHIRDVLE